MSLVKNPHVAPSRFPASSEMQNVEPSRIVNDRVLARLLERLDHQLVHDHVVGPRDREEDAVGDVVRREVADALVDRGLRVGVAGEADLGELGLSDHPGVDGRDADPADELLP